MASTTMAKKKPSQRSPKNKERKESGFRTIGVRVSNEYADWLEEVSRADRATIAGYLDRAAADRAKLIGFEKKPPERIP